MNCVVLQEALVEIHWEPNVQDWKGWV